MEINNDAVFEEFSPNQVRDLQLGMRHFFVNQKANAYLKEITKALGWSK